MISFFQKHKYRIGILLILLVLVFNFGYNGYNNDTRFENPNFIRNAIKFYYVNDDARDVFLKSSFDEWKYRYPFKKHQDGYWYLELSYKEPLFQLKKGTYHYKILVDGTFINDPFNKRYVGDGFGGKLSVLEIKDDILYYEKSPKHVEEDIYSFYYYSQDANRVYLVGNFNNWNPYIDKFEYKGNGNWILEKKFTKGEYVYAYVEDGEWKKDPLNTDTVQDNRGDGRLGKVLSYFKVE